MRNEVHLVKHFLELVMKSSLCTDKFKNHLTFAIYLSNPIFGACVGLLIVVLSEGINCNVS